MSTRVSTAQSFEHTQRNVSKARERQNVAAEKASTQKELSRVSDNPTSYVVAANLKDDINVRETISRNASLADHSLAAADNALVRVQESLQRAHELALQAAGKNPSSELAREHITPELKGIYESLIQTLNTRFGDRTIFAGLKNQGPAFNADGQFLGDDRQIEIEIDRKLRIPVSVSGRRAILGDGLTNGIDILGALKGLITGLESNHLDSIRLNLGSLANASNQVSTIRTEIAGRRSQIEKAVSYHESSNLETQGIVSKLEDADTIKAFSDFAREQVVLQAAIQTGKKLLTEIPPDLLLR